MPPLAGGATERAWDGLARRFAAAGHQVTCISRTWPGLANDEERSGVRFLRADGFNHRRRLITNILLDLLWGFKVLKLIPPSDVVICNTITLPAWLGWLRPKVGRVVVHIGRTPKGQTRFYGRVSRVYVPSHSVAAIISGTVNSRVKVLGYPIEWELLARQKRNASGAIAIGYVGRLHPEKGIELLVRSAVALQAMPGLPDWKMVLTGPSQVRLGGGGAEWLARVQALSRPLGPRIEWREPEFDKEALAAVFAGHDIFCYPSLAERGETFGVAVAEAMAAQCAVIVSALDCFKELVQPGQTGLVFDHTSLDAPNTLAELMATLLRDRDARNRLARQGQSHVEQFDFGSVARRVLEDLAQLTADQPRPA